MPLRQMQTTASMAPCLVSNNNLGAGAQETVQQNGGSHNVLYNADTIYYHGKRALDRYSLAFCGTNSSGARTATDAS